MTSSAEISRENGKKGGRPSEYKPEYAEQARKLCLLGATDQEVADFFEITARGLYKWKNSHADLNEAMKAGKSEADDRVERSLYQQAVGYEQDEVKIFMPANAAEPVYAPFRAKVAPNVAACIFWLKNRRRDEWRDKVDHELSGPGGAPIQTINSNMTPAEAAATYAATINHGKG